MPYRHKPHHIFQVLTLNMAKTSSVGSSKTKILILESNLPNSQSVCLSCLAQEIYHTTPRNTLKHNILHYLLSVEDNLRESPYHTYSWSLGKLND